MIRLPVSAETLLWIELAICAVVGAALGHAIVYDWTPALIRRARRRWSA